MELKSSFKLSVIFLLAAAPTSMAMAAKINYGYATPCSFCGLTLGLGLGATTFMSDLTSSTTVNSDIPSFIIEGNRSMLATPVEGNSVSNYAKGNIYRYSPMGAVFIGYGMVFDNYTYLGAELGANVFGSTNTSLRSTASHNTSVTSIDTNDNTVGLAVLNKALSSRTKATRNSVEPFLDLKAGWLMTPTALAYIRGGINYNTLKVKTNSNFQADGAMFANVPSNFPVTASTSSSFETSRKKSEVGYRAGIGMEVMITPEFSVGADYVYTFYQDVKVNGSGTGSDVACDALEGCQVVTADNANSTKAHLSDQQVMAQLIYHFGNVLG